MTESNLHNLDARRRNAGDLYRLKDLLAPQGPIPVGRSTWLQWVADGIAPQPLRLGRRVTVWRGEDIDSFLNSLSGGNVS